jgi:hypothetical protein
MALVAWLMLLTGAYPLWHAWRANRETTLLQALAWALAAWAAWAAALAAEWLSPSAEPAALRYLALCLTACALIGVLGARRPGVGAWNFVLLGLLAVLLLPLAEGLGGLHLTWPRVLFLAGTLAVGVLNYLPTRLGPAALLLALGCALELASVLPRDTVPEAVRPVLPAGGLLLALSPWAAYTPTRARPRPAAEFDRLWLGFRDRFGLVWGQRLREQFNRSAAHAGWPVVLRWTGLRLKPGAALPGPSVQEEILATLRALLKRFGPEEKEDRGPVA